MSEKPCTNVLENFLVIARSLNDHESAVEIINKVIDSPAIYSFGDLLEVPLINSMKNSPQFKDYYDLLNLFSYGTYLDYASKKSSLPALSPNAIMKLRHLSIISLASKCRTISYQTLSQQLDVKNIRELEDLIIEAFYADIIKGKLDQVNNQLEIDFAIGRDVTDEQVDEILNVLNNWCKNCGIALQTIEKQISEANIYKQKQIDYQNNIETEVANLKKSLKLQSQEVESMNSSSSKENSNKKYTKSKK